METFANDIEFRPAEEIKAFQEQLLQKAKAWKKWPPLRSGLRITWQPWPWLFPAQPILQQEAFWLTWARMRWRLEWDSTGREAADASP